MSEENQENKEVIEIQGEVQVENKETSTNNESNIELNKENISTTEETTNNDSTSEKEEAGETTGTNGQESIQISNDVIAVIAGVAVSEVSGVASMAGGFAGGISEVLSGKKNMAKGIKVDKTENKLKIDVNIIVEYGTRIPDIAFDIQNRVKKAVENMTGLNVEEVNVHVQGVDTNIMKNETRVQDKSKDNTEDNNN